MDTKEKNRSNTRQRKPAEAGKRREQDGAEKTAPRRKPAVKPASDAAASRETPKKRTSRPAAEQPRSGAERDPQPRKTAQRKQTASYQRSAVGEGVRFEAPQGTGPRKSAPKPSRQETEELRRKQLREPPKQEQTRKNALQNLISGKKPTVENPDDPATKAEQRRKLRAQREEKKRKTAQKYDTPAVIYTQPQAFNRDRLLVQLLSVVAVVAALVIGMSVFFKVKNITVAGAETYSTWAVREASGIEEGDSLLTFSKARAVAKIHAELSYVDNVRIGIKLPDTVIIYIDELDVAYALESAQGDWWLINSEGKVVNSIRPSEAGDYTRVTGIMLDAPQIGLNAVAVDRAPQETLEGGETVPMETLANGEPVPLSVTGAQRLKAVLQILKALEANDIVGEATSINVQEMEDIVLNYGSQYEVLLGDANKLDYKIACMNDAILQMSNYQAGILDVSFTTWPDKVGYTPFG